MNYKINVTLLGLALIFSSCQKDETPSISYFEDGEWTVVKESAKAKPAEIVFLGDGYVKEDFEKENGKFISDVREGVSELFAVEPFKTYENYFKVYAVAAYSEERGMSYEGQEPRKTRFNVLKSEGTGLACNEDTVFMYTLKIPGMKDRLQEITNILISNEDVYSGTCFQYNSGEVIAIVPVSRQKLSGGYYDYGNIIRHEAGGHGFGYMADEYVLNDGETIPEDGFFGKQNMNYFQSRGLWKNLSLTNESSLLPWAELVGLKGYEAVTNPEGGLYYEFGVWRSEMKSCMIDNMPYFSAAQRLAIVKRLKKLSGETFSLSEFQEKDTVRKPDADLKSAAGPSMHIPLAPPVLKVR